jgi:hypothetical protein
MIFYSSIFILGFSLVISFCTGLAIFWYLFQQKQTFLQEALAEFAPKIEALLINFPDAGPEIEKQIDNRLDEIIATFKRHIPMIGMFLSQNKEEELRGLAKNELMKLMPIVKHRYLHSVNVISNHAQDRFSKSQIEFKIHQLYTKIWKQLRFKIFGIMIAVGLIMGFIEIGFFYLLFH